MANEKTVARLRELAISAKYFGDALPQPPSGEEWDPLTLDQLAAIRKRARDIRLQLRATGSSEESLALICDAPDFNDLGPVVPAAAVESERGCIFCSRRRSKCVCPEMDEIDSQYPRWVAPITFFAVLVAALSGAAYWASNTGRFSLF